VAQQVSYFSYRPDVAQSDRDSGFLETSNLSIVRVAKLPLFLLNKQTGGSATAKPCLNAERHNGVLRNRIEVTKRTSRFVVEYKSARRKETPNPNSIWGNLDLRSVARQLQNEAHSIPDQAIPDQAIPDRVVASGADPGRVSGSPEFHPLPLTSDAQQLKTTPIEQEGRMAEDNDVVGNAGADAAEILPTASEEPKKPRGRRKKTTSEASGEASGNDVVSSGSTKTQAKRGRPKAVTRGRKGAAPNQSAAIEQPVAAAVDTSSELSAPLDELEDLVQLEQENQRLRKLLAEKLREENSSLRKRLGLD
jgi:hypothetical protein